MIYKAYSSDTNFLLSYPETGMGYQIIDSKLPSSDVIRRSVVYNCELVVDFDKDFELNKQIIKLKGFTVSLNEARSWSVSTNSIRVLKRKEIFESRLLSEDLVRTMKRTKVGNGATENQKEPADGKEGFVRLSAYSDDKRIDFEKKRLRPGSYTTTQKDYLDCVQIGDNPIDRYALPNENIIEWAFHILPKYGDVLQRGIVQPANGHSGGGIEAYFESGTSDNTFIARTEYGK